jgi:branched-chain amino acid transport system substrate-binding protein
MTSTKSIEPAKVAKAMEGMKFEGFFGPVEMRADDHQFIQPLHVMTFARRDGKKVKFNADGTKDFGFREDVKLDGPATALPTTCQMARPSM